MTDRTALILGAALALMAAPAFAQEAEAPAAAPDAEKINMVIVYGEDKCEESSADTINVCARLSEGDRYRIPTQLRDDMAQQVAEMSCSNRLLTLWARKVWPAASLGSSMASMNSPACSTVCFWPV